MGWENSRVLPICENSLRNLRYHTIFESTKDKHKRHRQIADGVFLFYQGGINQFKEPVPDFSGSCVEIYGGESYVVALYVDRFVN